MLNKSPFGTQEPAPAGFLFWSGFRTLNKFSKSADKIQPMPLPIYSLVRAKRRTIALIIERNGGLTVRAPKRATLGDIERFIHEKMDWILRTRERLKAMIEIPKKQFVDGETFLLLGNEYRLTLVPPQRPALKFNDGFTLGITSQKRGESLFIRWYKEQALRILSDRVTLYAARHGFSPKQVKVNSAKTRWGSCSSNGALNFTWRLAMAPLQVVDYVVIHELVHLKIKNHSPKFWKAVEALLPEYKLHRKWLRENGERLVL
jgi:hypothetical protein